MRVVLLALLFTACVDPAADDEDLGNIGDGKSDSFGIVDKQITITAGHYRRFTFEANAAFRIAVTQPDTDPATRPDLTLSLKDPDGNATTADAAPEPAMVVEAAPAAGGSYSLTIRNVGSTTATALLNVRATASFGDLPDPNAAIFPDATWQPPATDKWPGTYVVFNNTGCSHDCTLADQAALAPRSVMIKMLVTAIHEVKEGGIVRVSNFNISPSQTAGIVADALVWAMTERHATVKIVMDEGQNNATSKTTLLGQMGAQVRFLNGLSYTSSTGDAVGIMHSKIVAVDDRVVFTGSNNFSGAGFVTNEENSVVLRAPLNTTRIGSYICDVDTMFDIGVEAGQPQKADADRSALVEKLDQCNGTDVWFPPTGVIANGSSVTYSNVAKAIYNARRSVYIAPDMLAHPGLVSALISRARQQKQAGRPFAVKLILDASSEALENPAFGDCLEVAAQQYGFDMQIHYWPGSAEIFQLMHHKFMVIDADDPAGATLYNGSANYSAKALKWSFENVTRYTSGAHRPIVDAFAARFLKLFADGKDKARLASEDNLQIPACPLDVSTL